MCILGRTQSINSKTNVQYDIKSKYPKEYSTVDKVGREKLLVGKSCYRLLIGNFIFLVESGILSFGIRPSTQRIRDPCNSFLIC